ncbi:MAG: thioredoxin family protein [Coriobacteriales bacterium]|nr:thioredoxin family protein [Actinomycetes bacterium]
MVIKVLGSGCANCNRLEERVREALARLGRDDEVVHVSDIAEIMRYGVMSTPALVVDEEVRLAGRVPSVEDLMALLSR